ncbi:MAG TPA: hypothetical protein VGO46_02395 [Gemmatimonadaceae bacterium]|nr:hypothetical protein [Gemmatimonadaceae bacterium]
MHIATLSNSFAIVRAKRATLAFIASAAVATLLAGCGNRMDTEAVVPSAIVITSPSGTTPTAGTIQFSAAVTDADGHPITVTPTWSVVHGGGSISAGGLFTAGDTAGTFENTVVATVGSVSSASTVTVTAGALASITVTPETVTVVVGATQHFVAVGKDSHGNVVDISDRVWSVCGGGEIDTSGTFTAGTTPGSFPDAIHVSSGSINANASVVVTTGPLATITITPSPATVAIRATQQFTAVGKDAHGNVVDITPEWSVVASGGTIDASTGLFTAAAVAGTFTNTVRVSSGAVSATATVTIPPGALETITVTPSPVSLAIGAQQTFTAVGHDDDGNVVAITPTWAVIGGGGTITGGGVFTAGTAAGTFTNTVRATVGSGCSGIFGRATVTVLPGALTTITISPPSTTLVEGATQQFTATGADANSNPVAITPVWSVTSAGGGTIDASTGLYTAGSTPGSFTNSVVATASSIAALASVTITAPVGALATIEVTPGNPSLFGPSGKQFTATGYDASHTVVPITGTLTWSLNTLVAIGSIGSSTGLFLFNGSYNGPIANAIAVTNGTITGYASLMLDCGC